MNKSFTAALNELPAMLDYIRQKAALLQFKEYEVSKIVLAAEEALVNVISYGYPDKAPGTIDLNCLSDGENGIEIIIRDDGIAYNPLDNAEALIIIPEHSIEHTKIGGIGIFVILRLMDKVSYTREGECNVLSLIKKAKKIH